MLMSFWRGTCILIVDFTRFKFSQELVCLHFVCLRIFTGATTHGVIKSSHTKEGGVASKYLEVA